MFTAREFIESPGATQQADYTLALKANGTDIQGGITGGSLNTDGQIKITQWDLNVYMAREAGSSLATGRRSYNGIDLIGPVSKAAPLLFRALTENQVVEAKLRIFRMKPNGGQREEFMFIETKESRIADYTLLTSPIDGALYYNFKIVFHKVKVVWVDGGIEVEDTWDQNR